jgi:hypothetical protein
MRDDHTQSRASLVSSTNEGRTYIRSLEPSNTVEVNHYAAPGWLWSDCAPGSNGS